MQEASLFKLSSLQHQLSESVPKAVLEKANQEYSELVIKYQQCLQKQTAYAADAAAMERLQVWQNVVMLSLHTFKVTNFVGPFFCNFNIECIF